jgi:hypothetical protein
MGILQESKSRGAQRAHFGGGAVGAQPNTLARSSSYRVLNDGVKDRISGARMTLSGRMPPVSLQVAIIRDRPPLLTRTRQSSMTII